MRQQQNTKPKLISAHALSIAVEDGRECRALFDYNVRPHHPVPSLSISFLHRLLRFFLRPFNKNSITK